MTASIDTAEFTIGSARAAVAQRRIPATGLAENFYSRIKKEDPEIGAFLTLCEDRALAQATPPLSVCTEATMVPACKARMLGAWVA